MTLTGKKRDVHLTFAFVPGYEESWGQALVSMVDITERKRTECQVKELAAELGRRSAR